MDAGAKAPRKREARLALERAGGAHARPAHRVHKIAIGLFVEADPALHGTHDRWIRPFRSCFLTTPAALHLDAGGSVLFEVGPLAKCSCAIMGAISSPGPITIAAAAPARHVH